MKLTFAQMSAEDILRQYATRALVFRVIMITEILVIVASLCLYLTGKLLFGLTVLIYILVFVIHFATRVNQQSWFLKTNTVLQTECNPQKYIAIFEGIRSRIKEKKLGVSFRLNLARGYYLMGDFQKAQDILNDIEFKKNIPLLILQYHNTLANCCSELGEFDAIEESRKKVVTLQSLQKTGSAMYDQAQRVLDIIDGLLAIKDKEYEVAQVMQENLLQGAGVALQKATIHYQLAKVLEAQEKWDEAVEHYGVTIEKGGTIYFVEKAKERVEALCQVAKRAD